MCRDYWECDEDGKFNLTVAQVTHKHNLKSGEAGKIAYDNCDAYSEDFACSRCGELFVFSGRSSFQQALRYPNRMGMCPRCQIGEADALKAQHQSDMEVRRSIVREHYSLKSVSEPDIHSLRLEDVVYLLSFVRVAASEDLSLYGSMEAMTEALAPTSKYSFEIVEHLYRKKLTQVSPASQVDAFVFENDVPNRFYIYKVRWTLLTGSDLDATRRFIMRIDNTFRNPELRPFACHDQTLQLWRKVAIHECLQFLEVVLKEHGFDFKVNDKLLLTLEALLERHSVAQAYNFIWRAARRCRFPSTGFGGESERTKTTRCEHRSWLDTKAIRTRTGRRLGSYAI